MLRVRFGQRLFAIAEKLSAFRRLVCERRIKNRDFANASPTGTTIALFSLATAVVASANCCVISGRPLQAYVVMKSGSAPVARISAE